MDTPKSGQLPYNGEVCSLPVYCPYISTSEEEEVTTFEKSRPQVSIFPLYVCSACEGSTVQL